MGVYDRQVISTTILLKQQDAAQERMKREAAGGNVAANLNPKVIQARMGHATMAETMDTYG